MAMNSSRIHHFFITETRNRKPNNRGIHNRNRNFKNRARILISEYYPKFLFHPYFSYSQQVASYTSWGLYEPNNPGDYDNCAVLSGNTEHGYNWADLPCDFVQPFPICQIQ